jgi:hypothetical protein
MRRESDSDKNINVVPKIDRALDLDHRATLEHKYLRATARKKNSPANGSAYVQRSSSPL